MIPNIRVKTTIHRVPSTTVVTPRFQNGHDRPWVHGQQGTKTFVLDHFTSEMFVGMIRRPFEFKVMAATGAKPTTDVKAADTPRLE